MTPQERQQKLETLRAVGALAPLVTALYDANETVALNTVTNSIREALAPLLTVTLEDDGAIKPGPFTDSVGAGKSYSYATNEATAKPTCDCTGCRLERGEAVSDADRAQYEKENQQFQRVMDMLTQGRIFGLRG